MLFKEWMVTLKRPNTIEEIKKGQPGAFVSKSVVVHSQTRPRKGEAWNIFGNKWEVNSAVDIEKHHVENIMWMLSKI